MKNLYQILGIEPGASPDQIKRAYYGLAKIYHPDSGPATAHHGGQAGREQAEVKKFYEVTEAYQILSDAARRQAYDGTLKTGKLEKGWMESNETMNVTYGQPAHEQTPEFRMHELHRYRRRIFWQAVGKVAFSVIAGAIVGNVLGLLFNGSRLLGMVAGVAFGFVWAVNSHFDLESFIPERRYFKLARFGGLAIQAFSLLYFAGLFLYHLLRAA